MTNPDLARDYLERSRKRVKAIRLLYEEAAYADVVRESQEVVELLLKAVLRSFGVEVPHSHDLSQALVENGSRFPAEAEAMVPRWAEVSKTLRRDRELAFYGSEDITPSKFYSLADAEGAMAMAEEVLASASRWIS